MILKTDRHINLLVLHCSDTYKRMLVGAKEITQWHVDRGWSDCGYKPEDNFTAEQKKTLAALIINLQTEYPNADIKGHNELSSKSCPNFSVKEFMSNIEIHLFN